MVSDIFNGAVMDFVSISCDVRLPLGTGRVARDKEDSEGEAQPPAALTDILALEQAALPELGQIEEHSHGSTSFFPSIIAVSLMSQLGIRGGRRCSENGRLAAVAGYRRIAKSLVGQNGGVDSPPVE